MEKRGNGLGRSCGGPALPLSSSTSENHFTFHLQEAAVASAFTLSPLHDLPIVISEVTTKLCFPLIWFCLRLSTIAALWDLDFDISCTPGVWWNYSEITFACCADIILFFFLFVLSPNVSCRCRWHFDPQSKYELEWILMSTQMADEMWRQWIQKINVFTNFKIFFYITVAFFIYNLPLSCIPYNCLNRIKHYCDGE